MEGGRMSSLPPDFAQAWNAVCQHIAHNPHEAADAFKRASIPPEAIYQFLSFLNRPETIFSFKKNPLIKKDPLLPKKDVPILGNLYEKLVGTLSANATQDLLRAEEKLSERISSPAVIAKACGKTLKRFCTRLVESADRIEWDTQDGFAEFDLAKTFAELAKTKLAVPVRKRQTARWILNSMKHLPLNCDKVHLGPCISFWAAFQTSDGLLRRSMCSPDASDPLWEITPASALSPELLKQPVFEEIRRLSLHLNQPPYPGKPIHFDIDYVYLYCVLYEDPSLPGFPQLYVGEAAEAGARQRWLQSGTGHQSEVRKVLRNARNGIPPTDVSLLHVGLAALWIYCRGDPIKFRERCVVFMLPCLQEQARGMEKQLIHLWDAAVVTTGANIKC